MSEKPTTFEMLGPVDTGPEADWCHWGNATTGVAMCGERDLVGANNGNAILPGELMCPDCARIRRERTL